MQIRTAACKISCKLFMQLCVEKNHEQKDMNGKAVGAAMLMTNRHVMIDTLPC